MRRIRATDLNLRRLQSSHSPWLDGRNRKRLRQDLQRCTVSQWDPQSKKTHWIGMLVVYPEKNYKRWLEWNVKSPSQKSKLFLNRANKKVASKCWLQVDCVERSLGFRNKATPQSLGSPRRLLILFPATLGPRALWYRSPEHLFP